MTGPERFNFCERLHWEWTSTVKMYMSLHCFGLVSHIEVVSIDVCLIGGTFAKEELIRF